MKLPTDEAFMEEYERIKLLYTVIKGKIIILNTITPSDILLECYKPELILYKGVMISKANASKDMFKVNLLAALKNK